MQIFKTKRNIVFLLVQLNNYGTTEQHNIV